MRYKFRLQGKELSMKYKLILFWTLVLSGCLLLIPLVGSSQIRYNGHITDVATGEDIAGVQIQIVNKQQQATSDVYGNFLIKNSALPENPSPGNAYSFFYNSLIWEGDLNIALELYSLDGRLILTEKNLGNMGSYLFPRLQQGMYILRVNSQGDPRSFKLFSNGIQTFASDTHANFMDLRAEVGYDTLLFSKQGYFEREIVVSRRDTVMNIKFMQGNYESLDYFNELIAPVAFDLLQSSPPRSNVGGIKSIKFIDNRKDDQMYYMNTKVFKLHIDFATEVLGYRKGNAVFNQTQYKENPERYMYPGSINYYPKIDKYVLQLVAINEVSCENLLLLYQNILESSYFGDKLVFFANKEEWQICEGIPQISSDELFSGQNYQALNLEKNYGYLQKVEIEKLEDTYLGRHDIVLLNGIPNDVSVVAGIITTEFQTPLSHINVLSNSRRTPNMALRDGWDDPTLNSLLGELVYLEVQSDSFIIRKADLDEAINFWAQREPQNTVVLAKNTQVSGIIDLEKAKQTDVNIIGGKAANFAEILNVNFNGAPTPVPENSFAIPFHYYQAHIENAGLDQAIEQMLIEDRFISDPAYRKAKLETLQDQIKVAPIDPALVSLIRTQIGDFQTFPSYRFRSSTNAEDLENFSGAGLYDSYSAKKNHDKKTIENAVRKVWASLWNWRAFEERSYFKIDHLSCAMGILVHRSFPDEDANGVLITRNLYNQNLGFIINVQFKEYSIVFPEPGVLHDQIMLVLWSNQPVPEGRFIVEYLSFSNIPELKGERVMTDAELNELGEYAMALKQYFYTQLPHDCGCEFKDFALDIEFKVDSEISPRKLYIKQARLFK